MNVKYVFDRVFPFAMSPSSSLTEYAYVKMNNICRWICKAHSEKVFSRNETSNLMTRIRNDYDHEWEWWYFISESRTFDDFIDRVPEYMSIRATYPSRDKEPIDPLALPWSNEKLYGRGINSNVREIR